MEKHLEMGLLIATSILSKAAPIKKVCPTGAGVPEWLTSPAKLFYAPHVVASENKTILTAGEVMPTIQ